MRTLFRILLVAYRRTKYGHSLTSQGVVPPWVEQGGRAGRISKWNV